MFIGFLTGTLSRTSCCLDSKCKPTIHGCQRLFLLTNNSSLQSSGKGSIRRYNAGSHHEGFRSTEREYSSKAAEYSTFTLDCWTSPNFRAFLGITGHFIDMDWKLKELL